MVRIVAINPYDQTGYLLPFLLGRIADFSRLHPTSMAPETLVRMVNARLAAGDPNVLLLAAVGAKGDVVGHAIGTLEEDPIRKNRWVFCWQCRVDPGEGSSDPTLVRRFIEMADEWGHSRGATELEMATPRNDVAWQRKYGFVFRRATMAREIGAPVPAAKKEDEK